MKTPVTIALIVVLLIPVVILISSKKNDVSTPSATPTPSPTAAGTQDPADTVSAHKVVLHTSDGDIAITMFPEDAPLAVKNFVTLGKRGYYNGVIFHRIVQDFMVQSGDPTGTGSGGSSIYGSTFPAEVSPKHTYSKGTLGMARTSVPNSYGSQFFITTPTIGDSAIQALNGNYSAFGQVADDASMAVVGKIAATPVTVGDSGENSKPTQEVKITGFDIVTP
jgi:cyclophilin family peptidyl-prolyl cis-trans isomerase